jgi:hypothetical protein
MKKELVIALFILVLAAGVVSAEESECNLDINLLNQDPIHAVPGEYVKVVLQISGVENAACETVNFRLLPEYPFSLDPGVETTKVMQAGTFTSTYNSQATIPFTLRVDKDALDDTYDLKAQYSSTKFGSSIIEKTFNISVEDVKTDFEVFVDDYVASTGTITLGILNTGKNDVEALTVEVPKQNSISVKGSNKAVIGTLDANQDTTFTYEAYPQDGSIKFVISYNDKNGDRRSVEKTVTYDSSYFTGRLRDQKKTSIWNYIIPVVIIILIGWFVKKRFFKKKENGRR